MFASTSHDGKTYRVNPYLFSTGSQFGHYMESITGFMLMYRGYMPYFNRHGYDITAKNSHTGEILRIEVKAARCGKDGRYKFGLYKTKNGKVKTDHRRADIIIFHAVSDEGDVTTFIVPTNVLDDVKQFTISSNPETYDGKLSPYKNRWDLLQ